MWKALWAAVAMTVGTAAHAEWNPPGRIETTLFIASEVLVLYDGLQTLDLRNHVGRGENRSETNPLMPAHPSQGTILAFTGLGMLANGLVWYVLPSWHVRGAYSISLILLETDTVLLNRAHGMRVAWVF